MSEVCYFSIILFLQEFEYIKHKTSIVSKVKESRRIQTKTIQMSQPYL